MLFGCALVASALFSGLIAAQSPDPTSITVVTPSYLFECGPVELSWNGGVAPYTLGVYQAGSLTEILETLSQTSETAFTWIVNQPAGTSVTIGVVDSQGNSGFSAQTPAIGSGSTGCLGGSSASSSSSVSMMVTTTTVVPTTTIPVVPTTTIPDILTTTTVPATATSTSSALKGLCYCTLTICEHNSNTPGCDTPLPEGNAGDTPIYCDVGTSGNQDIWLSYSDFVYDNTPYNQCINDPSASSGDYCTCQPYSGSVDSLNTTIEQYPTNAQGYVTDPNYYDNNLFDNQACYCDIFTFDIDENNAPVGYFSLGTQEEPIFCDEGSSQLYSVGNSETGGDPSNQLVACAGYGVPQFQKNCRCKTSTATPSGNYQNLTTAQAQPSVMQSRVSLIQQQVSSLQGNTDNSNGNDNNDQNSDAALSLASVGSTLVPLLCVSLLAGWYLLQA